MSTGRNNAFLVWNTVMAAFASIVVLIAYLFGQDIEAKLFPIVSETKPVDGIYRDKLKSCFMLHLIKNSSASPGPYIFYARAHLSPLLPLSVYISDPEHRKHGQLLVDHEQGEKWPRVFCFELPATVSDNQSMTIYGHAEHHKHVGWDSLSYFPPFKICGLMPDDPPADAPASPDPYCDQQRKAFNPS